MNEPRRWLEDGTADPELRRLVGSARPPQALDAAAFERSRKRLVALGSAPAAFGVLVWVKHAALGAVLGLTVAVAASAPRLFAKRDSSMPVPSATLSGEAPVRVAPPPRAESPVVEKRSVTRPPAAAPASAPSASAAGGLSRELALLEAARAEVERRPGSALALLSQHEREFPRGTLALEREFLVVSALVGLNRRADAEARANALRARSPGSLYERRLDEVLGGAGAAP